MFYSNVLNTKIIILPCHFSDRPIKKLLTTFAASMAIVVLGITNCPTHFAQKLSIIHSS